MDQGQKGRHKTTLTKLRWLLSLARPDLGARPIADISAAEILVPLREVEARGNYETARRLRATIGQVFRYAIATARAENDPTFGLRGALVAPTVTHRSAITERKAFGGLLRAIWDYDGMPETRAALQLMALLYPRPGELRQAEWAEFDLERALWTIPSTRTKTRREHRKPLSQMAVMILLDLQKLTGHSRLAFRSIQSPLRTMSENTMNAALRRLGYVRGEFNMGRAHSYRLLDRGRVIKAIEDATGKVSPIGDIPEGVARELKSDLPGAIEEIKARSEQGEDPAQSAKEIAAERKAAKEKDKAEKDAEKAEKETPQAEHDHERDENRAKLPAIKQQQVAKEATIQARKANFDDGLTDADRIAELEEAVRVLEEENASLKAENALYGDMKAQWTDGGWDAVIAGKNEEIRVLETRLYRESEDKAPWSRSTKHGKPKRSSSGGRATR